MLQPRLGVLLRSGMAYAFHSQSGTNVRCIYFGGDSSSGGRTPRERATPVQAEGTNGRHYQGSEASLVLPEARREKACQGSPRTQTEPEEGSQGTGLGTTCRNCSIAVGFTATLMSRPAWGGLHHLPGLLSILFPIAAPALHHREKESSLASLHSSYGPACDSASFRVRTVRQRTPADLALRDRGMLMELQFLDRVLNCSDCRSDFIFTAGEQLFFHEKQFKNDPKRCKNCKARRLTPQAGAPGTERPPAGAARTETRTSCSDCGVETTVPFKPTQGRPVLCRQCYQKKIRVPPGVPAPASAATNGVGLALHEVAGQLDEPLLAVGMQPLPHAVTTEDAVAALAALPADAHGTGISPEAALMAGASISSAQPHSSVTTLEDLESITASAHNHDSRTMIPLELLSEIPAQAAELVAAVVESSEA